MPESATVPPVVNRTMKFVLRSPLHAMVSKTILLITFTGRKSGKTYTTPVNYSQTGDKVSIFTHATWWKNLRNDTPVSLRIQGRELQGLPETVVEDKQAIATGLAAHLRNVPSDARYYEVSFDEQGNPNPAEVQKAVETVVMVRLQLC
ncbi:MAG: nitroreductase family deazaflavin-dependent oxidoreductase [Anaerolineales bacterium]|nr:nitroreductase family deazaflavin-dependent oxidoreductase [Anaerolineales bacterium]